MDKQIKEQSDEWKEIKFGNLKPLHPNEEANFICHMAGTVILTLP